MLTLRLRNCCTFEARADQSIVHWYRPQFFAVLYVRVRWLANISGFATRCSGSGSERNWAALVVSVFFALEPRQTSIAPIDNKFYEFIQKPCALIEQSNHQFYTFFARCCSGARTSSQPNKCDDNKLSAEPRRVFFSRRFAQCTLFGSAHDGTACKQFQAEWRIDSIFFAIVTAAIWACFKSTKATAPQSTPE